MKRILISIATALLLVPMTASAQTAITRQTNPTPHQKHSGAQRSQQTKRTGNGKQSASSSSASSMSPTEQYNKGLEYYNAQDYANALV
ncbi:MAG: hypothetical protein IJ710_08630 [Prevotella sp.]|nr:hypothetical protein [Prevotella sp.]